MHLLPKSFYQNSDVLQVAKSLVGKVLVSDIEGILTSGRIVETEAYRGSDDKGCHSFIHGKTDRTAVMFEEGGVAYVYICYGMHHMINVVTNMENRADAVLIRAIQPLIGQDIMLQRRGKIFKSHHLSGGPGKVCQCLNIDKTLNNIAYYLSDSPIRIYDDGYSAAEVAATPRVGMSMHVAEFTNNPWRFYEKNNSYVSRPLSLKYNF